MMAIRLDIDGIDCKSVFSGNQKAALHRNDVGIKVGGVHLSDLA